MKPISCGIRLHCTTDDTYFICHATQPNYTQNDNMWTIPKGMIEPHETPIECALRELFEETGLNLPIQTTPPHVIIQAAHKTFHVFCVDVTDEYKSFPFHCTSIINNPKVPHMNGYPECDQFGWFSQTECYNMVFNSLKILFTKEFV